MAENGTIPAFGRYSGMSQPKVYDTPSDVNARDGVVTVEGPDHVDIMMTPDAAVETSDRLLHGAMKARGQQHFGDRRKLLKPGP